MAQLAEAMENPVAALIVDETGLTGRYDLTLDCLKYKDFAIEILGTGAADFGPACNQALKEFGLKLELQKRPVEVLVIDHVEKTPTQN